MLVEVTRNACAEITPLQSDQASMQDSAQGPFDPKIYLGCKYLKTYS